MPDSNLQGLTEITDLTGDDLLYLVNDPAGTPQDRKIKSSNAAKYFRVVDELQILAATAVEITTAQTAQTVVNAQPAGTTFFVRAGTHTNFVLYLTSPAHDGDKFIFEPGAILDRGNAASRCITGTAKDVRIRGWSNTQRVSIRNYKPTVASTTILGPADTSEDSRFTQPGWEMGYFDMLDCNKVNVRLGPNNWLHHASITNAGTLAIGGGGRSSLFRPTIVEYVSIVNPNVEDSAPGDEGGGTKFAVCNNIEIRHCTMFGSSNHTAGNFHDAFAWWFDVDVWDYHIHHCTADHMPKTGIVAEISGRGRINNNRLTNGGYKATIDGLASGNWQNGLGAGIQIASSGRGPSGDGIIIEENTIDTYNEGIIVWEQPRGLWQNYPMFDHYSADLTIVRNTLNATGGTGVATDIAAWASGTSYTLPGTRHIELATDPHVHNNNNIYRLIANASGSGQAPSGTATDNTWWHYVAPHPHTPARRIMFDANTYTNPTAYSGTVGPFLYNGAGGRTFAYWQGTALMDRRGTST